MYPYKSVLVFFALLYCVITLTVGGKLPDLATLCPYNDFCTTKATKTLAANESELTPCCQKCSCEPDCQLFGNCCPDKELTPDVQVKYPCVSIYLYYNKPRNITLYQTYDLYYHVINDCPTRKLLSEYPRCFKLRYLEDYAFVSDPLTGRVYQNKHCARCNGVFDYTEWYLSTDCSMISDVSLDEWLRLLYTSCEITPIPPEPSSGQAYRCFPQKSKDILKCNSTGELETIDAEIQDACEFDNPKTNSLFYQDAELPGVYQNPYCKLCNADNGEGWTDLCKPLSSLSPSFSLHAFSVLLNFFYEEETDVESSSHCKQTELWDPFQESCMNVSCPMSSILLAGRCIDIYRRFPEQTYNIFFKVDIEVMDFVHIKIKAIHRIISEAMSNRQCHHCETLLITDDRLYLYLRYTLRTRDGCSEDYLIKQVKLMIDNPPVYVYSKHEASVKLVPDTHISNDDLKFTWALHENSTCVNAVDLNKQYIDRCPRVPMKYLPLNLEKHDDIDIRTEDNGTMCVGEYFRFMQSLNGSYCVKQYHWVTIFVTTVAYYVTHN